MWAVIVFFVKMLCETNVNMRMVFFNFSIVILIIKIKLCYVLYAASLVRSVYQID